MSTLFIFDLRFLIFDCRFQMFDFDSAESKI